MKVYKVQKMMVSINLLQKKIDTNDINVELCLAPFVVVLPPHTPEVIPKKEESLSKAHFSQLWCSFIVIGFKIWLGLFHVSKGEMHSIGVNLQRGQMSSAFLKQIYLTTLSLAI